MSKKEQKMTILVGDGDELLSFHAGFSHPERVVGIFCSETISLPEGLRRLGSINSVPAFLDSHRQVQRLYCGISCIPTESAQLIQTACKTRAVKFCAVLPVINSLDGNFVMMHIGDDMLLTPESEPLSHAYNRFCKGLFDLLVVLVFMLVLFPLIYIFKAIVLKRKKRGSSFSTQYCCGPTNHPFRCISFRDEQHSLARVFNVLKGDMSLVGPEPYTLESKEDIGLLPKHVERRGVRPGMTGWAQLHHLEGEERLNADIWYVEHWSLWLDIRILVQSIVFGS